MSLTQYNEITQIQLSKLLSVNNIHKIHIFELIIHKIMMSYMNYALTQYHDFRTLQFNYAKLRDQNIQLRAKLIKIQYLYQQQAQENYNLKNQRKQLIQRSRSLLSSKEKQPQNFTPQKSIDAFINQAQIKENENIQKCVKIPNQIYRLLNQTIQKLKKSEQISKFSQFKSLFSKKTKKSYSPMKSFDDSESSPEKGDTKQQSQQDLLRKYIINSCSILLKLQKKNKQLQQKLHEKATLAYKLQQQRDIRQQKLIIDMNDLEADLQRLQNLRADMKEQNKSLKQQNEFLEMKIAALERQLHSRQTIQTEQQQQHQQHSIQDHSFAIDILGFEKQLLKRIFVKLASGFSNKQMANAFKDVYQNYQNLVESYKEKVQIQYDLQDLQCGYKKEKKIQAKGTGNLLIEMRKKIEVFRAELQSQNQLFYERQALLEQKITQLQAQEAHQNKMKHYTLEIEKKLQQKQRKNMQSAKSTRNMFSKQNAANNFEQESDEQLKQEKLYKPEQVKTLLNIKHSSQSDDLMKQIIQKDRQNLQKILNETRMKFTRK